MKYEVVEATPDPLETLRSLSKAFLAGRATTPTRKQIKRPSEDVRGLNEQMRLHSTPVNEGIR